ncbi:dihydroorotase [Azospira sp. I13]|uniref:dihydroorotase n=1 Tax=Azospira sp. I13 TaxID=1765050 RepID=UPI000D4C0557|nr:dihydroorotase [Azospira sp. I13]GBG03397.1 dihydroorotase [Azospira sp. I13]
MNICIKNGRLVDPKNGIDAQLDLFIADGRIAAVGQAPAGFTADKTIEADGAVVCPGLIDLSVRLPSLESELAAAIAGGVTTVVCPPDTKPVLDEPGLVERLIQRAEALGLARVLPLGALTRNLEGQSLASMAGLASAGCVAFSQADRPVTDLQSLYRAMQYAATYDFTVWLRPQDYQLARDGVAHDGEVAARLGLAGIPVAAETVAIATLVELAKATGVRLHLMRISSAAGVAMVRDAQAKGARVTCDVAVHHLHLSEEDIGYFNALARFDPPLRAVSDRAALRFGLAEGTVGAVCSDHTPTAEDGKLLPFGEADAGNPGLTLLLPLVLAWAEEAGLSLNTALARVTSNAAAIIGRDDLGHLAPGAVADVCVFDPAASWTITPEAFSSVGRNSPLAGRTMKGRVLAVVAGGRPL